jgi:hypothetical protein
MRSSKNTFIILLAVALPLVAVATARHGRSQKDSAKVEDATPVQVDAMTERQRQHSKLYGGLGSRDLRKTEKSISIVRTVPFIEGDNVKTPSTMDGLLRHITCSADLVVVGTVLGKASQLTEDGTFVFTDYEMRVEELVGNNADVRARRGDSIVITRPGGAVKFNDKTVRVTDKSFQPLEVGGRYLMSLRQIPSTGAYRAVDSESSFELNQDGVRRLTAKEPPYVFVYRNDSTSFLNQVRTAEALCSSRLKEGAK